ncbi:MAG: primosomal protein N' [Alphaproteobacteria bacterium]|jgi:primosomal protein N' (replication factor Y) (superfamily II helicase)|nr:primosomal protein N' [Alphaproteobacteria bacterium]MBT4711416.1 primosomal protein N' [Alphaproteobacteria bacterium]MBT5861024.1 primosomal protein N' [Alphaproteobacteria bacterium]
MEKAPATARENDFASGATVAVLVPLPLAGAYDYRVPDGITVALGDFVTVPLGPRQISGVVWAAGTGEVAADRLRDIVAILDVPPMPSAQREFLAWVSDYTLATLGSVLKLAMSVPAALAPPKPQTAYALGSATPDRMTPARSRVLEEVGAHPPRTAVELARAAGVTPSVVKGLANLKALIPVQLFPSAGFGQPDPSIEGPPLSAGQTQAAASLIAAVKASEFSVTLLDGVTGAGKTEVYLDAVAETLRAGNQALVLVPEISLTSQWLERFQRRFGAAPAEWHSDLTASKRRATWRAVAENNVQVVVGARSALFLPFPNLGLIVVDEEHDGSYKQEDGVIYNARDMAVVRARTGAFLTILVSATPSLETMVNTQSGRYGRVHLADRHGPAELPHMQTVDMRADPPPRGHWLSPVVTDAIGAELDAGSQAMVFLNRRGYAPLTLCRTCGHRMECPNCSAWLVEHRHTGHMECHHCGHRVRQPESCPECGAQDSMAACGPGVERVAEEIAALFPQARTAVMASDTVTGPAAAAEMVQAMANHEFDILIGTQIVAKGHHFPLLTVVAVVDADLGLSGGDLRATERTYQLLSQVAGRAGRAERPGRAFLQTYHPDHPVMAALISGDRDAFLAREAEDREAQKLPPFGRLVALIISGPDPGATETFARTVARAAPGQKGVRVLGPAPAPLSMLRGRHRHRLLLRAARSVNVQAYVRRWLEGVKTPSGVRLQVDVDPYSFL